MGCLLIFIYQLATAHTLWSLLLSRSLIVEHDPSSEDPNIRHLGDLVARLGVLVGLNLELAKRDTIKFKR